LPLGPRLARLPPEVLLVDEKAVRKGHGYVAVVLDGRTGELLLQGAAVIRYFRTAIIRFASSGRK
jgi:hypothetical protein